MPNISYTYTLTNGTTADASQVQANFDTVKTAVNGALDPANLTATTAANLGLNRGGSSSRGKSIITTTESRTGFPYGLMPTPDRVTVTLPTDGLIFVAYQALWAESVVQTARAAIFIGATQLKASAPGQAAAVVDTTITGVNPNFYVPLFSNPTGLATFPAVGPGDSANVTTGQVVGGIYSGPMQASVNKINTTSGGNVNNIPVGGPCCVFADAGTYAVSVQFYAASGTVTAKERKLWVWTMGFD